MSLLAAAVVTLPAVAHNSQGDHTANAPSSAGAETNFRFEVLSIRPIPRGPSLGIEKPAPNGFSTKASLWQLLEFAYGPPHPTSPPSTTVEARNLPSWIGDTYAIDARVSQADLKAWQHQDANSNLLRSALRAALKERCKLALHTEPAQRQMLELVIGKRGPRLKAAAPGATLPVGARLQSGGVMTPINNRGADGWNFHGATMLDLVQFLNTVSPAVPVRDRTGLTGRYDFTLRLVQGTAEEPYPPPYVDNLGLQLKPGKENRPILVIDHMDRPTQN